MAVYKVAQDVEADDKLIGPFSFRQFIYLLIVAGSFALAWALSRVFLPLAIIPLPLILFFGAIALPLRKDQPMEIYMGALLSYYMKPRRRLWIPDGIESLVEITAPKVVEIQRKKNLSQDEAERRLSYLASIADTGGWSIRNAAMPMGSPMISDVYNEAQQTEDILDSTAQVSRSFNTMLDASDAKRRQDVINRMNTINTQPVFPAAAPAPLFVPPVSDPYTSLGQITDDPQSTAPDDTPAPLPHFNPYPTSIHQSVIQPLDERDGSESSQVVPTPEPSPVVTEPEVTASATTVSPGIIDLANNPDLSIETMAHEAHRIEKRNEELNEEVVISFR